MKKYLLVVGIIGALMALLLLVNYWPLLFGDLVLAAPDALIPEATNRALERVQYQTGRYPLWQPWLFSGMPTVEAFSYLSPLYLPNSLLALFRISSLQSQLIHLFFAGTGMYLLLRRFSFSVEASALAGGIFLLNPYFTAMLMHGHGSQLMTAAYMPWMLLATVQLFSNGRIKDLALLALVVGLQLQRAHVQIAWYSWLLMLLFVPFQLGNLRLSGPVTVHRLLLFVAALALGIGMSTAIYLPASQYAAWSVRGSAGSGGGAAWEYAVLWSMHPLETLTLIVPGLFGFGGALYSGWMPFTDFSHYIGALTLFLALYGFSKHWREPLVLFAMIGILTALLLSFGKFFPVLFAPFYAIAPLFSRFRVPSMAMVMFYLLVPILAARGFDGLGSGPDKGMKPKLLRLGAGFAVVMFLLLLFSSFWQQLHQSLFAPPASMAALGPQVLDEQWNVVFGSLLLVGGTGLLAVILYALPLWTPAPWSRLRFLFMVLILVDLLGFNRLIVEPSAAMQPQPASLSGQVVEEALEPDEITSFLAARPRPFRIYPVGPLFGENKFALFGIESVGGYHPAKMKAYDALLRNSENLANLYLLRMLNAGYVVSPVPLDDPELQLLKRGILRLAAGSGQVFVYGLVHPGPRAWFPDRVRVVGDEQELTARMLAADASLSEVFVADADVHADAAMLGSGIFRSGEVHSVSLEPEMVTVDVTASSRAFLVLSELYYPLRWNGTIDGKPLHVVRVNGLLRGMMVPPGRHQIRFAYDRTQFELGMKLSLIATGAVMLLFLGGLVADRRARRGPDPKG